MPRKPRVHYKGALYHVICRGNNREWILKSDAQKQRYLELIKQYKKRYNFKLYAWVIMSNHVHLLIEAGDMPLSKIMQGIQQSYTQWYNKNNSRVGHVFEQRYKAIHCNKDEYLLNLLRYIHQNPVRINVDEGINYPWSSHVEYIRTSRPELTDIVLPLGMFSDQAGKARQLYLEFMEEDEDLLPQLKDSQLEEGLVETETALIEKEYCIDSFETIIKNVSKITDVSFEEIIASGKRKVVSKSRKLIIVFCLNHTKFNQKYISEQMKMSESGISKALQNGIDVSEDMEKLIGLSRRQA